MIIKVKDMTPEKETIELIRGKNYNVYKTIPF